MCIYEVIGWFRIGFVMSPVLEKKCWSWVLDHLVAADRMSRFSQEKGIEDLGEMKCISSVPLPRGLHIQDRFAAVEDLELF